jgi:hypothetical protein
VEGGTRSGAGAAPVGDGAPVCVIGMHRSGTSLVARLLNVLGVDLGPEASMLEPIPTDNPRGFWEQRAIMSLNDEILEQLGGHWWRLPELPPGWATSPGLLPLKRKARRLVDGLFGGDRRWGFKDPRVSVTLPFWQEVVPELRYIVCLRNPIEVAASLEARSSRRHGERRSNGDLWLSYTARCLIHTAGAPRLVISYEDLLEDTGRQLTRLGAFALGADATVTADAGRASDSIVESSLRHHATQADPMDDAELPVEAGLLYKLIRSAGSSTDEDRGRPLLAGETLDRLARRLLDARSVGQRLERENAELGTLRTEALELRSAADEARGRAVALEDERARCGRRLRAIEDSLSWRITRPLRAAKGVVEGERRPSRPG